MIGEEWSEDQQREHDQHAGRQRRQRCLGTGLIVERTRRQARRHRNALQYTRSDVGHALCHRLLIDVDPVSVLRREGPGVAGGLREPDQEETQRGRSDRRDVRDHEVHAGKLRGDEAAGNLTHECNVAILEVKRNRGNQPTGDEDQRARDLDR